MHDQYSELSTKQQENLTSRNQELADVNQQLPTIKSPPQSNSDQQYQQVHLPQPPSSTTPKPPSPMLSPTEQANLLLSLKLPTQNQNLLDLTCQQTNMQTSRSYRLSSTFSNTNQIPSYTYTQLHYQQLMWDRVVELSGPITVHDGLITSYKLYRVKSRNKNSQDFDAVVERRFSDFQYLHQMLVANYGGCLLPLLPEKSVWTSFNLETSQYVKNRRDKLQRYLDRLLAHHKLRYSREVVNFILDPDNNFSQQKGQYYQNRSLEQNLYNISSQTVSSTLDLLAHYLPSSITSAITTNTSLLDPKRSSEILMEESSYKSMNNVNINNINININVSAKDKQELVCFQIMINRLTDVVMGLGVIVDNTCQEEKLVLEINGICDMMDLDDDTTYTNKPNPKPKPTSTQSQLYPCLHPTSPLPQSYTQLLQQIQSAKSALQRHSALSHNLFSLLQKLSTQSQVSHTNPRNIKIDILRSKIHSTSKKYQHVTQQLLEELRKYVDQGKLMVGFFVDAMLVERGRVYGQQDGVERQKEKVV